MTYESVIGLEIHAELLTDTKIFCGCSTRFGAPPNSQVCPVCLGLPGALPVLNRRAVEFAIRAGVALGCTIQLRSVFARKHYFYPDLPKGYQISQYDQPIATNGRVRYESDGVSHVVGITRVHMEEDAGKSIHEGLPDSDRSTHLDFNRSGVPLVEIVTEPDLRSAEAAGEFFGRLRAILGAIDVNDGSMEEGSLRCDANVSIRPAGTTPLGVKVEIKNINSFRYLRKAIEYEVSRQVEAVVAGRVIAQETRHWDTGAGHTVSMRSKEEAHDYRYFPEPDLPPLEVSAAWVAAIVASMPELPEQRKDRFVREYQLSEYEARLLTQSVEVADYFETTARASGNAKAASNWIMGEVSRTVNARGVEIGDLGVTPERLAELIRLVETGTISGSAAKTVFERMEATGRTADEIVESEGLRQIDDVAALEAVVAEIVGANPEPVASYRAGKQGTLGFLVGQVMKATRGKANPTQVNELLRRLLEAESGE